jgi:hypothetical protein
MAVIVLGAKAVVAVLLVAAGGAKLADLPGFAASVRPFLPRATAPTLLLAVALGVALAELVVGAASLSSPLEGWLNLPVAAIGAGFVVVSAAGYAWHRGQSCRCFGALSGRGFTLAGIGRASAVAGGAAVAMIGVPASQVQVGLAGRLALLAGAVVVAAAAYTAAAAVGSNRDAQPGWAGWTA